MSVRRFPGQRAVRIALRTAHIASIVLLVGAATFGEPIDDWLELALLTGGLLVLEELFRYGLHWFRWLQSWVVVGKLALLLCVLTLPAYQLPALWTALVLGAIISHAPGAVRQFAIFGDPGPCATKGAQSCLESTQGELHDPS
ncbi:MAG TPA: hypothetical protein QGF58_12235 [Myxococcota bacterium]|nr:hypothetical protein [Myxococcota bacterium]